MTALQQYQRLESLGQLRTSQDAAFEEVVVQLGRTSLTFLKIDGRPITHWSLPALQTTRRPAARVRHRLAIQQALLFLSNWVGRPAQRD